mmetsp:Transcript_28656/g.61473  ORF Transcript_28656/g.61473 Transcript_28656/m.61473 type:complete len:89 (-) Transcript_28656:861-1127(-)
MRWQRASAANTIQPQPLIGTRSREVGYAIPTTRKSSQAGHTALRPKPNNLEAPNEDVLFATQWFTIFPIFFFDRMLALQRYYICASQL